MKNTDIGNCLSYSEKDILQPEKQNFVKQFCVFVDSEFVKSM